MTELRSCPFCGREPDGPECDPNGNYWVECSNPSCMCLIETDTEAEAIKAWNTRARPVLDTGDLTDDPLYNVLDSLYERGWVDYHKNAGYDARGCKQWQDVLDLFRVMRDTPNTREEKWCPICGKAFDSCKNCDSIIATLSDTEEKE